MVSQHLGLLGGDWSSTRRYLKCLIYQVTSKNHGTEGSSKFMSGSSSSYVTTLLSLVGISIVVVEICY